MESKMGENVFRMWSEKIFLRVRVRFVKCRYALVQILLCLDRDKNSCVGVTGALVASEKRLTVRLCFVKKTTNWACEWGETYGQTLFFFVCYEGYQSGLRVRGELRPDLFYFLFIILMTNWTYQWKRQTDSTVVSEISACGKKEVSLEKKKKFCFSSFIRI